MKLSTGLVAVVTGGGSGIGRALVTAFASRGLSAVAADVEAAAAEQTVAMVGAAGPGRVLAAAVDVRDPGQVQALAALTLRDFGRVDIICANAGVVTPRAPVWAQSAEDWLWTVEVNLLGVANVVRAFVPHLVAQGHGHVVCTSSIAGLSTIAGGGNGAYSASKHAVVGLCETLRLELDQVAPDVGVTVLCPGPVPSRIHEAARNRPLDRQLGSATMDSSAATTLATFDHGLVPTDASAVAEAVCAAIEDDVFYLLPGPGTATAARDRASRVLASIPAEAAK